MALTRVRIRNFRCLTEVELGLHPHSTFIYGPNGAGKTSLLEALFLLGRGRSFRTRQIKRLIRRGEGELSVFGEVSDGEGSRRLGVACSRGRLEKRLDGRDGAKGSEMAAALQVHVIDPGGHVLVEGGPSERRRFLDWGVFHVEHDYLAAWKSYRRALSQRNAALKRRVRSEELASWTRALVGAGAAVSAKRQDYVQRLGAGAERLGAELLGVPLTVEYVQGWAKGESLAHALAGSEESDRLSGATGAGPHRADLVIRLGESPVQGEASRGQQKLAAAALIVAQVEVGLAGDPRNTLLLIDDPAAELDRRALERLVAVLDRLPVQRVLTALDPEHLPPAAGARVFHVERGEVQAL